MSRKLKDFRVLTKIILGNTILFIFILTYMLWNYSYITKRIETDLVESNQIHLKNVSIGFINNLQRIQTTMYSYTNERIITSLAFTKNDLGDNIHDFLSLQNMFVQLRTNLNFVNEVYAYFPNLDTVITSRGSINTEVLKKRYINEKVLDFENNNDKYFILKDTIIYTYKPTRLNNACLLVEIDKTSISAFLKSEKSYLDNILLILDSNNQIVASSDEISQDKINQVSTNTNNNKLNVIAFKDKMFVPFMSTLKYQNFSFMLLFSQNSLLERLDNINKNFVYYLIAFMILNLLLVLVYLKLFDPMTKIIKSIQGKAVSQTKNEFEIISSAIDDFTYRNNIMELSLENQRYFEENHILLKIISDEIYDTSSEIINRINDEFGKFVLITLIFENFSGEKDIAAIQSFENTISTHIHFRKLTINQNINTYIVRTPHVVQKIEQIVVDACKCVSDEIETYILGGQSREYSNILDLRKAFLQANNTMLNQVFNLDAMVHYSINIDLMNNKRNIAISTAYYDKLLQYVNSGNSDMVIEYFNSILEKLAKDAYYSIIKDFYDYLFNCIYIIIEQKSINPTEIFGDSQTNITNTYNIYNIHNILKDYYIKLSNYHAAKDFTLYEKINKYINENYMKEITLSDVADIFNITPEYLSTYFKKHCGLNFTTYINNIRMDMAKKVLVENPDLSINEVAEIIGINNINRFIRLFKDSFGTTPGKYRKDQKDDLEQ